MLLNCDWEIGTTFVGVIVCNEHALLSVDSSDSSKNVARWNAVVVSSQLSNLEEWRTMVKYSVNTLHWREFALL